MAKTFSLLRLLFRTNQSLLFHTITSEHIWSVWLCFWDSCLWDNFCIYPEYFSLFISSKPCTILAVPPLQLSACLISLEHWLAKKGRKGANYMIFNYNYKISSTYIKWCSLVFQIWWHISSLCCFKTENKMSNIQNSECCFAILWISNNVLSQALIINWDIITINDVYRA